MMMQHTSTLRVTGSEDQIILHSNEEAASVLFLLQLRDGMYPSMWESRARSDQLPDGSQLWRREHPEHLEEGTGRSCRCGR